MAGSTSPNQSSKTTKKKGSRPGCIDYSKWDQIEYPSSDEDITKKNPVPRPKAEHGPTSVIVDKDGKWQVQPSAATSPAEETLLNGKRANQIKWLEDFIRDGDIMQIAKTATDAATNDLPQAALYWSQDRHQVVLNLVYDPKILDAKKYKIDVVVEGAVRYDNRLSAGWDGPENNDGSYGSIRISYDDDSSKTTTLLEGSFPNYVHLEKGESQVTDWTIYNYDDYILLPNEISDEKFKYIIGKKILRVNLLKAVHWGEKQTRYWNSPILPK